MSYHSVREIEKPPPHTAQGSPCLHLQAVCNSCTNHDASISLPCSADIATVLSRTPQELVSAVCLRLCPSGTDRGGDRGRAAEIPSSRCDSYLRERRGSEIDVSADARRPVTPSLLRHRRTVVVVILRRSRRRAAHHVSPDPAQSSRIAKRMDNTKRLANHHPQPRDHLPSLSQTNQV